MKLGKFLGEGVAKLQFIAFRTQYPGSSEPLAVCYKLKEIKDFITRSEEMFDHKQIPLNERGVGFMLGIHLDQTSAHAKNKPTIMMMATQFVDSTDPTAGQVDSINNPVIKAGWPVTLVVPADIDDVAYDAGALWP